MTIKNKFLALSLILLISVTGANASELTEAANKDWLELVRRYISADKTDKSDGQGQNLNFLSEWWHELGDNTLTELINDAFISNRDLSIARAKVLEARAQLGLSRENFSPKTELSAGYTNGRNSDMEDPENKSYNQYTIGFDSSWEIDFFGKNKHIAQAAKANLESEYADLNNAWVSLSAEVAVNYITLRVLQNRLDLAQNDIKASREILDILNSQYSAGLIDELPVQQAKSELESLSAKIPEISQLINERINALAILTGQIPGSINQRLLRHKELPDLDVQKLIGIPAEALKQRPDIKAAERRLASQAQTRKAAEKSLYPVIQLIGSIGLESMSTGHLFSSGSYTYSIGPAIKWPIFHIGEIKKNIKVQSAVEEQYLAELESVILNAVREVHDALNANSQEFLRGESLNRALKSAMSALEISRNKYSQGLSDFSSVLKAQKDVYLIQDEIISSEGQKIINLIILFKSLGGGWRTLSE